ncbi:hypothetical protein Q7C_955 [Methylophaga frappieri]|uniref:Uncharacterized protein n=1 Tax=Methylophaga frappieri (strain ATCC BAA-2434 / DSM 25690 / JAM7) TaxID=754477 RepID=I1YGT1_METFJ|nr:hypothetical protein Q7C_955 [Methylophaga frappieri]
MRFQVFGEVHHRLVVSPLGSKQQSLGLQVVYYGDVVLPAPQAGLVDAHSAHRAHVVQLPGLVNVVLEAPPQRLVCTAQQLGRLAHRQLSAKRQSQGLEQRGEARTLARPRHAHLRGLAAAAARHTWHIGVQPRLELEEVQMSPRAPQSVMDALRGRVALRAAQQLGVAPNLEINASLGRVQVHLDYFPRCHQAQRAGEQRLHSNTHFTPRSWAPAARMDAAIVGAGFHTKRHRATPTTDEGVHPIACGATKQQPSSASLHLHLLITDASVILRLF